jgi:excisionase family DNA binding protein
MEVPRPCAWSLDCAARMRPKDSLQEGRNALGLVEARGGGASAAAVAQFLGRFRPLAVINSMETNLHAPVGDALGRTAARLLTAEEVAARLGVRPSWVNKAARGGRIPHVRVGCYRRFRWPDIEVWLDARRSGA